MRKWKEESVQVKVIFIAATIVFLMVVIPLFAISHYNFRSADDFDFSETGERVWEETHSVIDVLAEQALFTKDFYQNWQGTFFDVWFSTSIMGIFSKDAYYIGTYLTLGSFILAEILLLMVVLVKVLGSDVYRAGIVTLSCLSIQILLTPVPSEAYFWFCGSIRYVFIHSLGLLLLTSLILMYRAKKIWQVVLLESLAVLLSVAVGGSNYITALTILLIYCLAVAWAFYKGHSCKWLYICNTVLYLSIFLINVKAPGNQIRQSSSGIEPMSVVATIWNSSVAAATYVSVHMTLPCIILGILLFPLFVNIVKKSKYRYPVPLLASLISFGIFAAQFTPSMYALHWLGAGRVENIYHLNFYLLLYGNELYWIGG